ncbi:DUF4870 family protein [Piscinibacter sp.]|jgi:uncharacterized membrane protein|uniref:DUF4870 family protein n=1 Tax=Piscinibacter sp. TaxID=1903157 RepID=UPI002F407FBE
MTDIVSSEPAAAGKTAEELAGLKNIAMVVYALQALSFLWGVTAIIGIVINYVKREDARGTLYESHFDWQIRSFWWGLLWSVVGVILIFVLVGFFVLFATWVWMIYRVVKGWLKLNEGKPVMPA